MGYKAKCIPTYRMENYLRELLGDLESLDGRDREPKLTWISFFQKAEALEWKQINDETSEVQFPGQRVRVPNLAKTFFAGLNYTVEAVDRAEDFRLEEEATSEELDLWKKLLEWLEISKPLLGPETVRMECRKAQSHIRELAEHKKKVSEAREEFARLPPPRHFSPPYKPGEIVKSGIELQKSAPVDQRAHTALHASSSELSHREGHTPHVPRLSNVTTKDTENSIDFDPSGDIPYAAERQSCKLNGELSRPAQPERGDEDTTMADEGSPTPSSPPRALRKRTETKNYDVKSTLAALHGVKRTPRRAGRGFSSANGH
ncbi:hypothetical protein N7492_009116 [Penicillium capsulatum]|uniref:Uncharacterized protein n=1 Tax=Penicillium capsulatum TaxID=69766 RepID=A0A9W9LHL1_9EURO|nr:hypothetical protein N7492_009116 [Penicillium capsulatum]